MKQSPKPPAARVSGWGATGSPDGKPRRLTKAQLAEISRKRADLYEKLRQLTVFERERRRRAVVAQTFQENFVVGSGFRSARVGIRIARI